MVVFGIIFLIFFCYLKEIMVVMDVYFDNELW